MLLHLSIGMTLGHLDFSLHPISFQTPPQVSRDSCSSKGPKFSFQRRVTPSSDPHGYMYICKHAPTRTHTEIKEKNGLPNCQYKRASCYSLCLGLNFCIAFIIFQCFLFIYLYAYWYSPLLSHHTRTHIFLLTILKFSRKMRNLVLHYLYWREQFLVLFHTGWVSVKNRQSLP